MSSWTKLLPRFILPSSMLSLSQATSPQQRQHPCMQPHQAFRPDKAAATGRAWLCLQYLPVSPSADLPSFQSGRNVTGPHSETNCWQGGLGHPDWLTHIRNDLPGLRMLPFSPEIQGHEGDVNTQKCGRKGKKFGIGKSALNAHFSFH